MYRLLPAILIVSACSPWPDFEEGWQRKERRAHRDCTETFTNSATSNGISEVQSTGTIRYDDAGTVLQYSEQWVDDDWAVRVDQNTRDGLVFVVSEFVDHSLSSVQRNTHDEDGRVILSTFDFIHDDSPLWVRQRTYNAEGEISMDIEKSGSDLVVQVQYVHTELDDGRQENGTVQAWTDDSFGPVGQITRVYDNQNRLTEEQERTMAGHLTSESLYTWGEDFQLERVDTTYWYDNTVSTSQRLYERDEDGRITTEISRGSSERIRTSVWSCD